MPAITVEQLENAALDVVAIEQVVNSEAGDADVVTRLGPTIKPLAKVVAEAATAATSAVDIYRDNIYSLMYGTKYAYPTNAAYVSSPPVGAADGDRVVIYADPNPGNNVTYKKTSGSFVEQGPASRALWTREYKADEASRPEAVRYNATWNSGANNDGLYGGVHLSITRDAVTNFNPGSSFFRATMDGIVRFDVNNGNGNTYLLMRTNTSTDFYGIGSNGGGSMTLFSKVHPITGEFAPMVVMGWAATVGEVVEVNWQGTQRVHQRSAGAFILDATNSRMEWEGSGAGRFGIQGYISGSADQRIIDFNNTGMTSYTGVLVSISSVTAGQKLLQFCTLSGSTYTEVGYVTETGLASFTRATLRTTTPIFTLQSNDLGKGTVRFQANGLTTPIEIAVVDADPNVGNMRIGTTRASYWTEIISNSLVVATFENNGNLGIGLKQYGGGVKVISMVNATTVPTTNPVGGAILYVENGAWKARGSSGTVTTLAPA